MPKADLFTGSELDSIAHHLESAEASYRDIALVLQADKGPGWQRVHDQFMRQVAEVRAFRMRIENREEECITTPPSSAKHATSRSVRA